jgi:hypothetical protein
MCFKDDLSAAAVAVLRCGKQMEKLPHYYFSCIVSLGKHRQIPDSSSGDKRVDQKYLERFEM